MKRRHQGQLLSILREKDQQIVKLEMKIREKDQIVEFLKDKISKMEKELSTYAHIVEVKDRSIVKLSNDLHEFDLNQEWDKITIWEKQNLWLLGKCKITRLTEINVILIKCTVENRATVGYTFNCWLNYWQLLCVL